MMDRSFESEGVVVFFRVFSSKGAEEKQSLFFHRRDIFALAVRQRVAVIVSSQQDCCSMGR